ncbi:hypothetical protein OSB04_027864 [Centaurea solstitialis]|uniref:Zinc finger GRF-type domain-containing protein n=1 Tax=Centaurea solstitialis TaxID=347529 RepID=A0AA38SZJ2_9ASTR|nr:hypothetical protein OSB04_027864 [Centaurea solstitialis]
MLCYCGAQTIVCTSWTNANPGRRFFSCSRSVRFLCLRNSKFSMYLDVFSFDAINFYREAIVRLLVELIHRCVLDLRWSYRVYLVLRIEWYCIVAINMRVVKT